MKLAHAMLALILIGASSSASAQSQPGQKPPGTYNTPGTFTPAGSPIALHYTSYTVHPNGNITFHLVGGSNFTYVISQDAAKAKTYYAGMIEAPEVAAASARLAGLSLGSVSVK